MRFLKKGSCGQERTFSPFRSVRVWQDLCHACPSSGRTSGKIVVFANRQMLCANCNGKIFPIGCFFHFQLPCLLLLLLLLLLLFKC